MTGDASLIDYYAKRASEYDRIYQKPERQADLATLTRLTSEIYQGHDVLEIACGTGYWTQVISKTARSIVATDINEEVLEIARSRKYGCEVRFEKADIFDLTLASQKKFTAGLSAFWWSHVPKSRLAEFLERFQRQFAPGSLIGFIDNRFVPGSSTAICRTDDAGNTYQSRKLDDGSKYEVVKNFPAENEVRTLLADRATEIRWTELQYFWLLTYRTK